jgi:DNA replication and repair protein RecF
MYLRGLHLVDFKNFSEALLEFGTGVNVLAGDNGSGKTNLLDAIHFLCLTKSALSGPDAQFIRHGQSWFTVTGKFEEDNAAETTVQVNLRPPERKQIKLNREPYKKVSEHLGRFPVVLVGPEDTSLIKEGSEERRKFFDGMISQADPVYLDHLLRYNRSLEQRNSLLKRFAEQGSSDLHLLDACTQPLLLHGEFINQTRSRWTSRFLPTFARYYHEVS